MIRRLSLAGVALLLGATAARAQVYSIPTHLPDSKRYVYTGTDPIAPLTEHLKSGNWQELQNYGLELLGNLAKDADIRKQLGDVDRNFFYLVWVSTNSDGKDVVNRVLVHKGLTPQHAARLPGIKSEHPEKPSAGAAEVRDVLLTPEKFATLTSVWVFTPTPEPLATQLPDVSSKINVLAMVGRSLGTEDDAKSILVYVNKPDIIRSRAKIQIKDTVTILRMSDDVTTGITKTKASVLVRQARTSECARRLAAQLEISGNGVLNGASCKKGPDGTTGDSCSTDLKKALLATLPAMLKDETTETAKICKAERDWGVGFDPVVATEQEFVKLVGEAAPKVITAEASASNVPLTRYSFGVMTGVLVGHIARDEPRLKVDGGKIVKAPMDRVMSMVVLNVHPTAYDADWPDVGMAERFRLFGGAVLTPDFGFTAGAGFGIVRGLSFNVGAVWLFADTLRDGETIGEAPVDKNDPFKLRVGRGTFIGFSYAFK